MALAQYPYPFLPLNQRSGYGGKRQSGVVSIKMESGYTRNRRKFFGQPARPDPLTFIYTDLQFAYFEAWVENELNGRADSFIFKLKTPLGLVDHTVKMIEDYKYQELAPNLWKVTFAVEVEDLTQMDGDVYGFYSEVNPEQNVATDVVPQLEQFSENELPKMGDTGE